ncbi:metallophosphoesterase [Lysobacter korlensis]|uniref:Metallophosphoesterase n=1 Tax=Lysobacter korlensis TaxID=553636 RepID=A0ABV6S2W0_9GAMM
MQPSAPVRPARRRVAVALGATLAFVAGVLAVPPAAAADREDFTFVVVPDTQAYSVSDALAATFTAQTRWIVDNRDDLNVSFVSHVGDLVESWPNTAQWQRASDSMAVLDAAGVPNAVLPGNHDMNVATGETPTFDQYFPPSRYATASWNSDSVRYGGYLGQDLFGQDPVDRGNKDSFSLLDVSGLKLLILSLEYESPQYALDWAQKVIDAHPDRRVILSTHGFLHTGGARSNTITRTDGQGLTAQQVWTRFVSANCSIFLVVNGHWHDGDEGEAHRTDPNSCGRPVHQVLSNYQARVNGGDGWLRYYTFRPDEDRIDASTYSPTLGRFETDADSSFSLDYDMTEGGPVERVLVRGGADWRWRFDSTGWPAGWTSPAYDASAWRTGSAALGFGTTSVATNIDVPAPTSNRPRSAQFRHEFQVADASALSAVTVSTRADDGVVVWVNGTEVGRTNLPTGALSATTYATAAPRTTAAPAATFAVPSSLLVDGRNVVTASTHLNYRGTPDVSFDLTLTATEEATEEPPQEPEPPVAPTVTGTTTATSASLTWTHPAPAEVTEYRVMRNGVERGRVPAPTARFDDSALAPDTGYRYGVIAVGPTGLQSPAGEVVLRTAPAAESRDVRLVGAGNTWHWRFDRTAWPAGWTSRQFDDSAWRTGAALLGFGGPVATNIDVPAPTSNRGVSAQFRTRFDVADASALSDVSITTRADDGVVVYVNGTEIGRSRLPAGTLTAGTYATAAPRSSAAASAAVTFAVPAGLLVDGVNVVAASTHLNYRGTPDVSFGLTVDAVASSGPGEEPGGEDPGGEDPGGEDPGDEQPQPQVLLQPGSIWRWSADRAGWASGWSSTAFDDSAWRSGPAVFGFGSAGVATNTDAPAPTSNRALSTQFRHTFSIADPADVSQVKITTRADDGVVAYVNGVEVGRANLPAGTLTGTSYATAAPRTTAASPLTFDVPAALLRAGTNVVAVSTHLNYRGTPDTCFDLRIDALVVP